jgi:uncharacterized paraquat-inducible protein A
MSDERGSRNKDSFLAAMYMLDPDRLRQLRRIASGVTRCPECDAANPASERFCTKCHAKLYPVEEAGETRLRNKRRAPQRKRD